VNYEKRKELFITIAVIIMGLCSCRNEPKNINEVANEIHSGNCRITVDCFVFGSITEVASNYKPSNKDIEPSIYFLLIHQISV
jgi:hypothetical protein